MSRPTVRDSLIPCPNCRKGTLHWNPEEKLYVCTTCGTQEEALKTWVKAGEHRQKKKNSKKEKDRQWALNILGLQDKLKSENKSHEEKQWDDILKKIKEKQQK
ncbi:MAG: hypothetical protein ACTSR2_11700 [Candidatus Hodarchaeales archaeon]